MIKCSFYEKQVLYMGHIISEKGVTVDPGKIKSIQVWSTPRNVNEVRSFMGLAAYYRRFIKSFSRIANPIASLQKKGVKSIGAHKCEDSFKLLKELLTCAPILKIAYLNNLGVCSMHGCISGRTRWSYDVRRACDLL